jgi:hypothetical protein
MKTVGAFGFLPIFTFWEFDKVHMFGTNSICYQRPKAGYET